MMNKNWLLGFIEGEGSFTFDISPSSSRKRIIMINPSFTIGQKEDKECLEQIKTFFKKYKIGFCISKKKMKNPSDFYYRGIVIGSHQCYRLKKVFKNIKWHTRKYDDFLKWSECVDILHKHEHLYDQSKLFRIFELREIMNLNKGKIKRLKYNLNYIKKLVEEGHYGFEIYKKDTPKKRYRREYNKNYYPKYYQKNKEKLLKEAKQRYDLNRKFLIKKRREINKNFYTSDIYKEVEDDT